MNTNINEDLTDIRPVTRALKQISMARLRGGKGHYEGTHHCALLMLDPDCVEMPPALLKDTVLQPVDKIVLLLIMMITRQSTGDAFLPTQAQLANAKPLPVADTLFLDPQYVEFLKKSVGHVHARVRKIAAEFLSQVPEEIRNRPIEQRTLSGL